MIPSSPAPEPKDRSPQQSQPLPAALCGAEGSGSPANSAKLGRPRDVGEPSHSDRGAGSERRADAESLESRAASGDPAACMQLALRLMRGRGVERNFERAVELFDIAARAGDIDALYRLGKCYLRGIGCAKDPAGAANCFERAAGCGHAAAAFKLGNIFEEGIGAPRSSELAAYWYRRAAYLGEPRAYDALLHLARRPRPRRPGR